MNKSLQLFSAYIQYRGSIIFLEETHKTQHGIIFLQSLDQDQEKLENQLCCNLELHHLQRYGAAGKNATSLNLSLMFVVLFLHFSN